MRVNALVRVEVERWTQVTPKSVEVKKPPPPDSNTAVWYWPVEDNDIDIQFLHPGAVWTAQFTPKSEEVQILLA